ncbi:acyl-CoA dehydrogenase family protein [Streptomyces gobiensis]|uniref:acyl-CoA dehydrogenase family protein n=1 Tax=Streptomyces gobiensis TaxID=2875706 RepID=UPI001E415C44|nr:acyl-CoA dehydrogenase family protein [Streptomyces gobiensis]UGY94515.1 acyl-CoA dehydrogenase family protein [Streptomyces gobiensis]
MNWEETPDERDFRHEVRAFARERFPVGYGPDPEAEHSLEPEDVWGYDWPADRLSRDPARRAGARAWAAALAERGWIAPGWPVEYGGAGLSAMREFILREEMMRAGVPTVNGIGAMLLGPTLLEYGTEEQRAAHLPGIARGETTWAQGFSEPGAGSDLASLRTRAVCAGPGSGSYLVNGQKVWTSSAQYADWLFVLVRTDPEAPKHKGITFLLIDASSPGVAIRPVQDMRGATPFAEIFFDDVSVPVANRVGAENQGWYVAMAALGFERAGIGATVKFEQVLSRLVGCLRSEKEPGCPGRDTAVLRHEIAQRYIELRTQYNLARHTASQLEAVGIPGHEASVSQLFGAELHQRLARTGAKAFGPYAQLWQRDGAPMEAAFAHMRFDAVAATLLGGTTEIQRRVIATRGLKLPKS